MAWNYSGDPATSPLDEVRFWLQDTDESDPILSDEEINYLIAQCDPIWGSAIATASICCSVVVSQVAREVSISGDSASISAEQLSQKYIDLGNSLRQTFERIQGAGACPIAFGISAVRFPDFDTRPMWAGMNSMDNPRAGRQDYSDFWYPNEVPDGGYWTGS